MTSPQKRFGIRWPVAFFAIIACGEATPPPASAPATQSIEPSEGIAEPAPPLGHGDEALQRCFEGAAAERCGHDSCVERCRQHDLDACHQLASSFDQRCSTRLWELVCKRGHQVSCTRLGVALLEEDPSRAATLLRESCRHGHGRGCSELGQVLLAEGRRLEEAVELFEAACQAGHAPGCTQAGARYQLGSGVPVRLDRAFELFDHACKLGDHRGCFELARAHLFGQGTARDEPRALELLEGLCHLDQEETKGEACFLLAQRLDQGRQGGTAASGEALTAYERACERGHFNGCTVVAFSRYASGHYQETIVLADDLLKREPHSWGPRYSRALSRFHLGRFASAAEDFERLCGERSEFTPHCHLFLWAARARNGADGDGDLAAARKQVQGWPGPVMDHFLGKMSEAELLRKARDPNPRTQLEQQCEAYYYLGQKHLAEGRPARARRLFEKTVATGISEFIEHAGAQAELSRMTP